MPRRTPNPAQPWTQTPVRVRTVVGPPLYTVTLTDATVSGDNTVASFVVPLGTWADGEAAVIRLIGFLKNDSGSVRSTSLKVSCTGAAAQEVNLQGSLAAGPTEYHTFGVVSFFRGGSSLYVPCSVVEINQATGTNMSLGPQPIIAPTHTFNDLPTVILVPTSFDADITVNVIVTLATTNASYYYKPKHACAYKTRHWMF